MAWLRPVSAIAFTATYCALALGAASTAQASGGHPEQIEITCLNDEVRVRVDQTGVPHITARDDSDSNCVQGYIHARDRFFQMDLTRRQASGDLAELFGTSALGGDITNRTIGLRRAAQRTWDEALSPNERDLLQAYADGVNAYILNNPLPVEYGLLELSQVRPWSPIDTLVIGKAIAASLSLDIDIEPTLQLQEYIGALGLAAGEALFFQDVRRAAPMDPASTVPDATGGFPYIAKKLDIDPVMLARAARGAREVKQKLEGVPFYAKAMQRNEFSIGSNHWGVTASQSASGRPIIANDPHLSLDSPSTFYEWHLIVEDDPEQGRMNVSGVGFPGTPGVILGQNERITWGATTNPMDVSDLFQDEFQVGTPACLLIASLACIISEGIAHPVVLEFPVYSANNPSDGILGNVAPVPPPPGTEIIATVPFRSFGPILSIDDPSVVVTGGITGALVLQYTGFHATRELNTFTAWNHAQNLQEFIDGLMDFDAGSQNWAYADADGNLAYFTSAENPLRKDLEQGTVVGLPPFFIRAGSGPNNWVPDPARSQGQAIPYDVLPFAEMPQTVNPANGFFVNANNDPAGVSLDNDPLNQVRPSKPTAIYYLNPSFANGLRAGRITRLVQGQLDQGKKIGFDDMKTFQSNTQQLDAELMLPFLLAAFENASDPGAPPELRALAGDPEVAEAVGRLSHWDFSTPTGIPEGYDADDLHGFRFPFVSQAKRKASVAATLYNLWRGKLVQVVVDQTLANLGVSGVDSSDALKATFNLLSQSPFTGVGVSGVDFFPEPAGLPAPEARRDATLLGSMRAGLDALASDAFAPAFGNSTDQDDYRWGKLHRITFDHPFVPAFSIPPAAGFEDLAPELPGVARDGGYEVVNASGFSARADGLNSFRFGSGPVRRYVGEGGASWGLVGDVLGVNVVPGGPSGDPSSDEYATQLPTWLTADYHVVRMSGIVLLPISNEIFTPPGALVPAAGRSASRRR